MEYLQNILSISTQETSQSAISTLIDKLVMLNQGIVISEIWRRWESGTSVNGGIIGSYHNPDYQIFKEQMNPLAGGNVDLTLTGALGQGLTIKKENGNYKIFSVDEKYNKIGIKYGFDEFGLTEDQAYNFLNEMGIVAIETIITKIYN